MRNNIQRIVISYPLLEFLKSNVIFIFFFKEVLTLKQNHVQRSPAVITIWEVMVHDQNGQKIPLVYVSGGLSYPVATLGYAKLAEILRSWMWHHHTFNRSTQISRIWGTQAMFVVSAAKRPNM